MSRVTLSTLLLASALLVKSQGVPLYDKTFTYPNLPYQVDTDSGERGTQFGYNQCNATTEGPASKCQTAFINSIDDFCVWGPPEPNSLIGNTEGEAVAWCTKPGRGTRLIPAGALQGAQFVKTPDYVQISGFIDQVKIDIAGDDSGGEMDPFGADQRGNPLGGLLFSNSFGADKNAFDQVRAWHNFMGANYFCLKACVNTGANARKYCEHIYDRIGCMYNAPSNVQNGTFTTCDSDNQDFPGIYTENGAVMTYTQPPESLGAIQTMPYQPRVPASSNCVTHTSSVIYASLGTVSTPSATPSSATRTGSSSTAARTTTSGTGTRSGTAAGSTASSNAAVSSMRGGVETGAIAVAFTGLFGTLFAVAFLA